MATRALREFDGKHILSRWINEYSRGHYEVSDRLVAINEESAEAVNFDQLESDYPWLLTEKLVVKPDQRIKRRGKSGLLLLNATWEEAKAWLTERIGREVTIETVTGILTSFLIEPFLPHEQSDEYYLCLQSVRDGEEILFYHEGGVDVGDVDSKAVRYLVPVDEEVSVDTIVEQLLQQVPEGRQQLLAGFIKAVLGIFVDLHFAYLEINPIVVVGDRCCPLDLAATLDEAASFLVRDKWGSVTFPPPFGRPLTSAEQYVRELDSKTGASLKLTLLNPEGRVWTMVAGGGASVVYADTISDLGFGAQLANYGEYSGAPSEALTYEYARTILGLMTARPAANGLPKVLIIGGGIANFTDVAKTFKGIVHALTDYTAALKACGVRIWVRRGGPNYQEGLRLMRELGNTIGVPIAVFGPETHITAVVPMALKFAAGESTADDLAAQAALEWGMDDGAGEGPGNPLLRKRSSSTINRSEVKVDVAGTKADAGDDESEAKESKGAPHSAFALSELEDVSYNLFTSGSRAIVYGMQLKAVQGMLDFDFLCKRDTPSVAAIVFPFSGNHYQKFYYGTEEVLIPVVTSTEGALKKFSDVAVMVNFASFRSAYSSSLEALRHPQLRTVAIIAEGIPERQSRSLIREASAKGVTLIGPATVGGIKPGCFRVGNTGGMLDNVLMSKLYRPGSVAYVSKSGGMSNELNNIICRNSDGVFEGVAIGGDRYPGTRFIDHLLRYEDNPNIGVLVLLGEVGGQDEYDVCEALKSGRITKPLVAWCIGTCAKMFPFEVQFGHAGALARGQLETADAKNAALRAAGAVVPESFDAFNAAIAEVYDRQVASGAITPRPEPEQPQVPMDYKWAKELGLVRKPTSFVSSICDDRGEELLYAGMPISQVFGDDVGVGGVLSLLWFRRRLPIYATKFIEMVLMVTADHGPAVSGAHNTIVCARAGKDLISSLCSGLMTIGPRFGGALDAAATDFAAGCASGATPAQFVSNMRSAHKLIMGIGHKIKSVENPDMRVTIIKEYAKKHFPCTPVLDFALGVEAVTTRKKSNLILNVDGCIACCFVDLLHGCGAFTMEEADELIANGCLNGLFVLGRSIGFIGHYLDQKRLKQGLYRHPWDDISYLNLQ